MKVVVAFAFVLAMVLVIVGLSVSDAVPVTKAEELPGFSGWYVLEEPISVTPNIWKYKIARGPHEPMIEAFASCRIDTAGIPGSSKEFPRAIIWYTVKATGAIFSPSGNSVPVNFLKPKY